MECFSKSSAVLRADCGSSNCATGMTLFFLSMRYKIAFHRHPSPGLPYHGIGKLYLVSVRIEEHDGFTLADILGAEDYL